jgi:hypothetical protein
MAETLEHRPYSRREIVLISITIVVLAVILGSLNTTTTTIVSASSGPLSISEYVVCRGFGEPRYFNSLDLDLNFTTYRYGHCFFGFWFSSGLPEQYTTPSESYTRLALPQGARLYRVYPRRLGVSVPSSATRPIPVLRH